MACNAKVRLQQVKEAVYRLHEVQLLIMNDCDDWRPQVVGGRRQFPNPTANAAIHRIDYVENALKALRAEESELTEIIGRALVVIQAVRDGLGDKYAEVLEWRFIDCLSWSRIRDDYGVAKQTGYRRVNVACDWVDSIGVTRIFAGDLEI